MFLCTIESYKKLFGRFANYFLSHFTTFITSNMEVSKWARCLGPNRYKKSTSCMGVNRLKSIGNTSLNSLTDGTFPTRCMVYSMPYHIPFFLPYVRSIWIFFIGHYVIIIKHKTFSILVTLILFFFPSFENNRFTYSLLNYFLMTFPSILRGK